jgi:hypothetical protein
MLRRVTPLADALAQQVYDICKSAASALDSAAFTLTASRNTTPGGGVLETTIKLQPTSGRGAPLAIFVVDGGRGADCLLGRDTVIEMDADSKWRPLRQPSFADDVRALVDATINGHVRETLWWHKGKIVRTKTVVTVDQRDVVFSFDHGRFVFPPAKKEVLEYEPYGGASSKGGPLSQRA